MFLVFWILSELTYSIIRSDYVDCPQLFARSIFSFSTLKSGGKILGDFEFICFSFLKFSLCYGKNSVIGRRSVNKIWNLYCGLVSTIIFDGSHGYSVRGRHRTV